ncbi:hypothetical protein HELRODRAFT_170222 [Helobdella robusta]|uniref:C2H2-type domain-containing protein n=1 Tax=Helobdella robusta TaxID=6412 RepID=T1F2T0_HELRO|nr:hypothetical protein HELRODRAFT_170222 [Helobdella robusta]ESO07687.1 hypothetical protein HELRODRAFT_170222 [Helobdella robusta]
MSALKVFPSVDELQTKRLENIRCTVIGCNKLFKHSLALRFHIVKVHNIIKLTESDKRIANKEKLIRNEVFYCPVKTCSYHFTDEKSKFFSTFKLLKQHHNQVHLPRKHACQTCSSTFSRYSDLKRHENKCSSLTCMDCKVRMGSRSELIQHGNLTKHNIPQVHSHKISNQTSAPINLCKYPNTKNKSNVAFLTDNCYSYKTIKPKHTEASQIVGLYLSSIASSTSLNKPQNLMNAFYNNSTAAHMTTTPSTDISIDDKNARDAANGLLFKSSNLKAAETQTVHFLIKENNKPTRSQGSQVFNHQDNFSLLCFTLLYFVVIQAFLEYKRSCCTKENNETQTNLSSNFNVASLAKHHSINRSLSENQINKRNVFNNFTNSETQTTSEDVAEHTSTQTIESFLNDWSKNLCVGEINSYTAGKKTAFMNLMMNEGQCNSNYINRTMSNTYDIENADCIYYNQPDYSTDSLSIDLSKNNFPVTNDEMTSKMKDNCSTSTQTYYSSMDEGIFNDISFINIETQTNDDFLSLASDEFAVDLELECMDIETQTHSLIDDFIFSEAETQTSKQDQLNILFSNIETQTHH